MGTPLFMQDEVVAAAIRDAIAAIPKGTRVYLTGGALRNAVYYDLFGKRLPQRDYDLLVVGDLEGYVKNLRARGFTYGKIRRKNHIVVKRKRIPKPVDVHRDHVFLDAHIEPEFRNLQENLRTRTNFTINQFIMPLRASTSSSWRRQVIAAPGALQDMRRKQLRLSPNPRRHPGDLFACIRFMSQGFKQPSKPEVQELLRAFAKFEPWRYPRNVQKVYAYVGGEEQARKLAKRLGLKTDIFDYREVKKLRNSMATS